jgi:hypothetical protein
MEGYIPSCLKITHEAMQASLFNVGIAVSALVLWDVPFPGTPDVVFFLKQNLIAVGYFVVFTVVGYCSVLTRLRPGGRRCL